MKKYFFILVFSFAVSLLSAQAPEAVNYQAVLKGNYDLGTVQLAGWGQPCTGIPTVDYGGQTYNTVQIGVQCWFKENLNVGEIISSKVGIFLQTDNSLIEKYCYDNNDESCAIYGGLYEWPEAMQYVTTEGAQGICPSGWHIPTELEWNTLINYLDDDEVAGGKMKEESLIHWFYPNEGATNSSGFTGLPGGIRHDFGGGFIFLGQTGYFWTSSKLSTLYAWGRYLLYSNAHMNRRDFPKGYGFSVRCLKDLD